MSQITPLQTFQLNTKEPLAKGVIFALPYRENGAFGNNGTNLYSQDLIQHIQVTSGATANNPIWKRNAQGIWVIEYNGLGGGTSGTQTGNYMLIPRANLNWTNEVTLTFFYKPITLPGGNSAFFDNMWGNNSSGGFQLYSDPSGHINFHAGNLSGDNSFGGNILVSPTNYPNGCMVTLVASASGQFLRGYINGVKDSASLENHVGTYVNSTANTPYFWIGANNGNGSCVNCQIGNIIIHNRALMPQEVVELHRNPLKIYKSNLLTSVGNNPPVTHSLTESLKYTVKVTPAAKTLSLKYTVKTTPAAKTDSLKYTVKYTPSAKSEQLKYTLKTTPGAKTEALKYTLKITPSSYTLALKYTVKATPSAKVQLDKYTIKSTPSAKTKSLQYVITIKTGGGGFGVIRFGATYFGQANFGATIATHALTDSLKYTIKSTPSAKTLSLKYTVKTTVGTILFADDYSTNDLTNYSQVSGTWGIANGVLYPITSAGSAWENSLIVTNTNTFTNFEITARIRKGSANDQVVFRNSGIGTGSGYGIQLRSTENTFRLENWGSSNLSQISYSYITGSYYRVRIRAVGNHIQAKIWADNATEPSAWSLDYTDASNLHASGSIGFSNENNLDSAYDNLVVAAIATGPSKQLTYSVKSTPSAKTLSIKYTVKATPAAKTEQLKYTVKSIPSAKTKSLQYVVINKTTHSLTLSDKYTIKASVDKTLSLRYYVKVPPVTHSLTTSLKYTIKVTSTPKTLSDKYTVKSTPTAKSASLKYVIKSSPDKTVQLKYTIKATTNAITTRLSYVIKVGNWEDAYEAQDTAWTSEYSDEPTTWSDDYSPTGNLWTDLYTP